MPVIKKTFSFIEPIFFTLQNEDNNLINNEVVTSQGLDLVDYELLNNANDQRIKNDTVNILTDQKRYQDFITFGSNANIDKTDLNTRLQFSGLGEGFRNITLNVIPNLSSADSETFIGPELDSEQQYFNIDFISDEFLTIRTFDGEFVKYLCTDEDTLSPTYRKLSFKILEKGSLQDTLSSYLYNYNYDKSNNYLTLSQFVSTNLTEIFSIIAPHGSGLSAVPPSSTAYNQSVIKLSDNFNSVTDDLLHTYTTYEVNSGKYEIDNSSVTDIKSNFMANYAYEVTSLSGSSQKLTNVLNLFNLKNEVSHGNYINGELPFKDKSTERRYTSILNESTQSQGNENLMFGYNFYTKEYQFDPDKYTKFTLPNSLFPFDRININDTSLCDRGAYAARSPYFSDKVFKRVDRNKNVNDKTRIEGALFNESSLPISLQDTNNVLQLQEVVFDSINNGTVLCSWLSGDENVKGTWYDRYYIPQSTNYTTALTGTGVPVFDNIRQALSFFDNRGIDQTYYDVKSNLSFEPQSTLYYQRIGHNYINETINNFDDYLVKSTFNNIFSGQVLEERDKLIFSSHSYDYIDVDTDINNNQFNVSFDLNLDSPTSLDSYQIFGNKFEDGFSLKNNFYFTPFVYLADGNNIFVYDSKFNLIQTNTYPTLTGISDILYLEQGSNFIIIGRAPENDVIIKSSFTGRVLDERRSSSIDPDQSPNEILAGYKSRYIYGSNQVVFNMETPTKTYYLNLNSLQISTSATALGLANSVLKAGDNLKSVPGFGAVKLTDDIAVSLSAVDHPGYDTLNYINMSNGESLYNPISAFEKNIYSIQSYNNLLYVQSFDSLNQGYIHIFDTTRQAVSSINLSVSAVSGYCLDFINDDRQLKLLSFSKQSDNTILVDKIDISKYSVESTYSLTITGNDYKYGSGKNYVSPVNFKYLTDKYSKYQNKLCFQFNIDNFLKSILFDPIWNYGVGSVLPNQNWNTVKPLTGGWDSQLLTETLESKSEDIFELPYVNINNSISMDFNFDAGIIDIVWNGELVKQVDFDANLIPNTKILFPDLYFNTPNISRTPISRFINSNQFYGKGGSIENIRLYNRNLKEDLIKYLYLKDQPINDLNFDITCGTRSGLEEVHNLYTYIIPGRKNNSIKVYIKNGYFSQPQQESIKQFLTEKLGNVLPQTTDSITFNFDINT